MNLLTPPTPFIDLATCTSLPVEVVEIAQRLLAEATAHPELVGSSEVTNSHWIESHTIGCRREGGDPEDRLWECHWEFVDRYSQDGISFLAGDPADGAFVSITPQLGSSGLVS